MVIRFVALVPLALVVLTALAVFVGRRLKEAAVVVENARSEVWSTCSGCNAHEWEQHDPWCPNWKRVVAGEDLEWQLELKRFYRDYDAYRSEHRLPGESR